MNRLPMKPMMRKTIFTFSLLVTLTLATGAGHSGGPNVRSRQGDDGEDAFKDCYALYSVGDPATLGSPVESPAARHIYRRYDSYFGDIVYLTSNDDKSIDPRPLAVGTIVDCDDAGNPKEEAEGKDAEGTDPKAEFSGRCVLSADAKRGFVRLRLTKDGTKPRVTIKKYTLRLANDGENSPAWEIRTESELGESSIAESEVDTSNTEDYEMVEGDDGKEYPVKKGYELVKYKVRGKYQYFNCLPGWHIEAVGNRAPRMVKDGFTLLPPVKEGGKLIWYQAPKENRVPRNPNANRQNLQNPNQNQNPNPPPQTQTPPQNPYVPPQPQPQPQYGNNFGNPWSGGIQRQGWNMPKR
jgi:hypothetical protein